MTTGHLPINTYLTVILFYIFLVINVHAEECPALPPLPSPMTEDTAFVNSWQGVDQPWSIRYTVNDELPAPYGVGYLKLIETEQFFYNWPIHMLLPVWQDKNTNAFYGWLYNGKIKPHGDFEDKALSGSGMVETDYEHNSFIVWDASEDGWLQLTPEMGQSPLWIHQCHLELGEAKFKFSPWEEFLTEHGNWLHFRDDVPHRLRSGADISSEQITMIGLDHKLILLEMNGDWMRVKVQQPDWTCTGPDQEFTGTEHIGWVKWRDDNLGPWVWVYTRGC